MRKRTNFRTQFAILHGAYMSGHFAMIDDVDAHVAIRRATMIREQEATDRRRLTELRSARAKAAWAKRKERLTG